MKDLVKFGDVLENVALKNYTSYKIGKTAKYMVFPNNEKDLILLLKYLKKNKIKHFILGTGSNIIIPNKDYDGVIIKLDNFNQVKINGNIVKVGAGYYLPRLTQLTVDVGLTGLEWALGIPSSIGGAVIGNVGAYLCQMYDIIKSVIILDENYEIKELFNNEIKYEYRHTMFKDNKNIIVLGATLELARGNYETSKALIDDRTRRRLQSQPLQYPSAGSVFRNPEGLFAGKLIEDLGLKGRIIGGAQISEKHANFIVNIDHATADDIIALINLIKTKVNETYGVNLILEQEIIEW